MHAPTIVSLLAAFISSGTVPLSTSELCWKKSIHGAMVVPRLASSTYMKSGVIPKGTFQVPKADATRPQSGLAKKTSGMKTRLKNATTRLALSQLWYLKDIVMKSTNANPISTAYTGFTPNMPRPKVMPMNSVTSVSELAMTRSAREKEPQNLP